MSKSDVQQAVRDGLLQGVKDHIARITDTIIADPGADPAAQVKRFANGLKATRGFYEAAADEISRQFGEIA